MDKERLSIIENEIVFLRNHYRKRYYLKGFKNINHGYCSYFADDLKSRLSYGHDIDVEIVDSDSLKLNPQDGDKSDWNMDSVKRRGFHIPNNIGYDEINKLCRGYHVWIYDKETNMHFDSEVPKGVKCLFRLPIYKRCVDWHLKIIKAIGLD